MLKAEHSYTTVRMAHGTAVAKDALAVEFGRRGARARMTKLSAEQRRQIARNAAQARWAKKTQPPQPPDPQGPGSPDRDGQYAEAGIMLSYPRRPAVPVSVTPKTGGLRAAV